MDPSTSGQQPRIVDQAAAIDADIPLKRPFYYDMSVAGPRIDRMEAKIDLLLQHIDRLEHRLAQQGRG